jgi:MFS superfamily sulfate permease-like transporter
MTVLADLIMAVAVGLVLASVLFVKRMADLELMNLRVITAQTGESPHRRKSRCSGATRARSSSFISTVHEFGSAGYGPPPRRRGGWSSFRVVVLDLSDVPAMIARQPWRWRTQFAWPRPITQMSFSWGYSQS